MKRKLFQVRRTVRGVPGSSLSETDEKVERKNGEESEICIVTNGKRLSQCEKDWKYGNTSDEFGGKREPNDKQVLSRVPHKRRTSERTTRGRGVWEARKHNGIL